ncbi:PREDICTED: uncharacterized protein LOC104822186 [Tarenaya hassleriana]|uniref:uncharacterized protein LOC104822186 n=1 Tax=Tarenaya hassleriana TaxID=28532 RepID=UPI00053CA0D8|nr:PREDICTED: uncharacterized protein LOC104822186 [Tarenaya hassleriana]
MAPLSLSRFFFIIFICTASISVSFGAAAHEHCFSFYINRALVVDLYWVSKKLLEEAMSLSSALLPILVFRASTLKSEKYRCSETGYRIPFKCIEITKETYWTIHHHRNGDLKLISLTEVVSRGQMWRNYQSLVFEGIMVGMLLISGTAIYIRKRRTVAMSGVSMARSQSNSRF